MVASTVAALIAGSTLAATPGSGATHGPGHNRGGRPNIVLVMTDDQALSQMSREVMPNVTRLLADQERGSTTPTCTTPLCCPSRATLLTGQYGVRS